MKLISNLFVILKKVLVYPCKSFALLFLSKINYSKSVFSFIKHQVPARPRLVKKYRFAFAHFKGNKG